MVAWRGNTVIVTTASVSTGLDRKDTVKDVKATERPIIVNILFFVVGIQ